MVSSNINHKKSPENPIRKTGLNANSDSNHSLSSLESQEIIKLLEETRQDECLSDGFRHLVVKLIRRNDLEGLQKAYRSSNRYWPIEDLVYFMEVMIQYSRFEMLEVIKEDLDEHGLFSNHNQECVRFHLETLVSSTYLKYLGIGAVYIEHCLGTL